MNIRKLFDSYSFHDGTIKSFYLDIQNNSAEIELLVGRRSLNKAPEPCCLKLTFLQLIEVSVSGKCPMQGYYLELRTFQNGNKEVGISMDVYDNSSQINEKHNWVIKSKVVSWKEIGKIDS